MPKCLHCGRGIENNEIMYRAPSKGGRSNRSIRLCSRCVEKHDSLEGMKHIRNIVLLVVGCIALLGAGIYLAMRR